ncbi:uncharacterized protein PV09_03028 [Verruconis gallopava]|uniref:Uncharacterized protein n=1 Tax=Verruconis gallopava TaxID=253628 RepID=A0A0D1YYP3_9PEZI|nr:uncharacterized protein PV09_03028 [Verruconis gallopava]KIW05822.1 hypothetical protein PV09_03028 [Verruconis gallopava]
MHKFMHPDLIARLPRSIRQTDQPTIRPSPHPSKSFIQSDGRANATGKQENGKKQTGQGRKKRKKRKKKKAVLLTCSTVPRKIRRPLPSAPPIRPSYSRRRLYCIHLIYLSRKETLT